MNIILFRNILSLFSLQGAGYLFPLIMLPYLTRVLGPTQYGEIGFATSFIQYFIILVDYGFNLSGTQAIARRQNDKLGQSRIFWSVTACKLVLTSASVILFLILLLYLPNLNSRQLILIAAFPSVFGSILMPTWLFQGMERMGGIAICNVIARAAMLPLFFLLVHSPENAWIVVLIQSLTTIAAGLIAIWIIIRQSLIMWSPPSIEDIREAFFDGWHVFISTAAVSLYTNSNIVVLGFIAGNEAVGFFVGADRIRQVLQGVTGPITQAVFPRINALMATNQAQAFRFIRWLTVVIGLGTLLLSVLLLLFAEPIVRILLGDRFVQATDVLRWLAFMPFLIGLNNIFGIQTMLPLGMKREFSHILLASGLLNITVIIPLSYFFRAQGAAASVLITETVVTLAMGIVLAKRAPDVFGFGAR